MIAMMSKLEIAGPKARLLEVLDVIREQGLFQPEADAGLFLPADRQREIHPLIPDEHVLAERMYLENLRNLTGGIIELLPMSESVSSQLAPLPLPANVAAEAESHLEFCRAMDSRRKALQRELEELGRCAALLEAMEELVGDLEPRGTLEIIGVTLRDTQQAEHLHEGLHRLIGGEFNLSTTVAADGSLIGLITTTVSRSSQLRNILNEEQFPELDFPAELRNLPLPERVRQARERIGSAGRELSELEARRDSFAGRWLPFYRSVDQWAGERLALFSSGSLVNETGMCFVILGWAPSSSVPAIRQRLQERFGGETAVEELKLLTQELDRVPVSLQNPPYFRPFELFTRLLPLPRYSSWDPTPFIGIFFPIFFGLMLGDAGHGLVLAFIALYLLRRRFTPLLNDAGRILLISACFAILFGILFGEFFGDAGGHLLGLTPVLPERSRSILPLLIFSVALGASHVLLGLIFGLVTSLRRHEKREAAGRIVTIALLICLSALAVGFFVPSPGRLTRPLLLTTGILFPCLLIFGGLLAPLELLKQIGNIVSYVRIMAIGLGSVLLANVANHLAGLSGDVIFGAVTAIILHGVAIVLGTFAPAIHALRLNFVEFLSKFVEPGGRRFEPLHK